MRPLQSIGMGLVVVALEASVAGGWDALPNPVGWLLVLLGVLRLPPAVPHRSVLLATAGLAGLLSLPRWLPGTDDALRRTDASLIWAADLPEICFVVVLAHALSTAARAQRDGVPARRLRITRDALVVAGVLTLLTLGADSVALALPAAAVTTLAYLALTWQLFSRSGRTWAGGPGVPGVAGRPGGPAPPD